MRNEEYLNRPVTQKVIAERSGVSPSLVSRILSGRLEKAISVSEEKLARVKGLTEGSGYGTMKKQAGATR